MEYFHVQHILFGTSDKRKYLKNPYAERKEKLGESEAESHNDSELHEMFFSKRKIHFGIFRKTINEIKTALLFSWPASNFLEYFYSCLSPFLSYVPPPEIYFCKFI